jgi:hypothetical protein
MPYLCFGFCVGTVLYTGNGDKNERLGLGSPGIFNVREIYIKFT